MGKSVFFLIKGNALDLTILLLMFSKKWENSFEKSYALDVKKPMA